MNKINEKSMFVKYSIGLVEKDRLFHYIWQTYGKRIYFYISKIISLENMHYDDLYQDIMLKIYNNMDSYDYAYSFQTWVYRLTRNHCIDFCKKKQPVSYESLENEQFYSNSDNIEENYFNQELRGKIYDCLNTLAPQEKEIAFLRLYEDRTFKDICSIIDMNTSTVKAMFKRIERKLIQGLKHYEKL